MEMDDHHHQQYGIADLRQLMNGPIRSTHFPSVPTQPTAEFFPGHRNLTPTQHQHYQMMMFGRPVSDIMPPGLQDFASDSATAAAANTSITVATPTTTTSASTPPLSGLEAETTTGFPGGGDASAGRWPRQETLTLLEIRSRLDPKFKEANQKGPLWDEVSR